MTWLKTEDGEFLNAWVFQVGNEAYGVYQRLNGYAAQQLTDGLVPAEIAAMIAGPSRKVLPALEIVGRIRRDELGTVRLPYFLDCNPSRAQVEADRDSTRRRQDRFRRKHQQNGQIHAVTPPVTNGVTDGVSHSAPTRPDPLTPPDPPAPTR